jgi:hypothetical protein
VPVGGLYHIDAVVSSFSTTGSTISIMIYVNGSAVKQTQYGNITAVPSSLFVNGDVFVPAAGGQIDIRISGVSTINTNALANGATVSFNGHLLR